MPDEKPKSDAEKYDRAMRTEQPKEVQALEWRAPYEEPFRLVGFPWFARDRVYRRLPVSPRETLPKAVDNLANSTAGGQAHVRTDSPRLVLKVKLRGPAGMNHMPATGQCGFDAYIGEPGAMRYAATARPPLGVDAFESEILPGGLEPGVLRNIVINFPLYQGVHSVEIGFAPGSRVEAPPAFARPGRVVFYGTSITQGGCACRPGMAHTNILSRRLNVEVVNLGFSGNGKGEPEVARTIVEIPDPILYVLDYEANAGLEGVKATLDPFIDILRAAQPAVPILVVSRPNPIGALYAKAAEERTAAARAFQKRTVARRRRAGDGTLTFFDGAKVLGKDWDETTVDGSHPTDLGFYRMAEVLEPVLRKLLFPA